LSQVGVGFFKMQRSYLARRAKPLSVCLWMLWPTVNHSDGAHAVRCIPIGRWSAPQASSRCVSNDKTVLFCFFKSCIRTHGFCRSECFCGCDITSSCLSVAVRCSILDCSLCRCLRAALSLALKAPWTVLTGTCMNKSLVIMSSRHPVDKASDTERCLCFHWLSYPN